MKKIISVLIFLIVVAAAIYGFYRTFDRSVAAPSIALKTIPQSAALILETDEAGELWRDLSHTNMMWEELQTTDFYFRLDAAAHALDSLLVNQKEFRSYIANKEIAVSVHVSGARDFNYLLSIQLEPDTETGQVVQSLKTLFRAKGEIGRRTYDGVEIYTIAPAVFDNQIYFFVQEGLLVMSMSPILAEEAVRALQQDASVVTNEGFMYVRKTRARDSRGEIYLNYKQFKTIVGQYASSSNRNSAFFNQPYAEWSALDLNLKSNAVSLNGFVMAKDSSDSWIGSFRDLSAPRMTVLKYMPSNTAYFAFFGYGDFKKYRKQQMNIYARSNRKYPIESKLKDYNDLCKCDMEDLGLNWIGTQGAAFIVEPESENYSQNHFGVFETQNVNKAWESLLEIEKSRSDILDEEPMIEEFGDFEIHRLQIGTFYGKVLSEAFDGLLDPYIVKYDDAIIMSTSLNALRNLLQKLTESQNGQNTLADQEAFKKLSDRISGNSHFLMYSALARSPFIYHNLLDDKSAKDLATHTDLLRKFQAFIYQVNYYKRDLYYNNIYLKYNPEYKKETNSLWEKQLKANISMRPYLLKNHYTEALEVFVQDEENRIYLIGNTGKLLWDMQVDGPIKSEVNQIDVYQNKKLQILFSTENTIYLLDRNGNNVESYPIKLPAKATTGITVADYDNSRDYRLFIGVKGGNILSYDVSGKKIDGWAFKDTQGDIVSDVQHIRIKSKDYIFAFNDKGQIHLLNRRGEKRHSVYQKITTPAEGTWQLDLKGKISESGLYYVDEEGSAYRQGFDERFTKVKLTDQKVLDYNFVDINKDGNLECIVLTPQIIEAFSLKGDIVFSAPLNKSENYSLQTFLFPDNVARFGIADPDGEQILLYDAKGKMRNGFPLYGMHPMAIGDMNRDGYFNLITTGKDGNVYAYAIE